MMEIVMDVKFNRKYLYKGDNKGCNIKSLKILGLSELLTGAFCALVEFKSGRVARVDIFKEDLNTDFCLENLVLENK